MAALLPAEDVAGAANLHVPHRDVEAGAKLRGLLNRLQALLGLAPEDLVWAVEQVGVGAVGAAADPAPELVELGQAEGVRVVDHHSVDVGDVDAGLDDRRRDEHVVLVPDEGQNHLLQHRLVHLTVPDPEAGLRHQQPQFRCQSVDVVDAVVDEVDLAAAVDLPQDHLSNQVVGGLRHEGADW